MTWDNRYRPLREGETILSGDECLTDSHLGWQPAKHDIGGKAPDPNYTSHRMYRRLRDDRADDPAQGWRCGARQRNIGPEIQDCDWPICGCDPYASKVLNAIEESGFKIVKA